MAKPREIDLLILRITKFVGGFSLFLTFFIAISSSIQFLITFWVVAGAYFACGSIIGFLFGIPRASAKYRYNKDKPEDENSWYRDNTNLEEISDWLTKIIVGVSLVQFDKILERLDWTAIRISDAFVSSQGCYWLRWFCITGQSTIKTFYVFGYALPILYLAFGFILAYPYVRAIFPSIFAQAQVDAANVSKGFPIGTNDSIKNDSSLTAKTIEGIDLAGEIQTEKQGIPKEFEELVKNALNNRTTIIVKDDLQKYRWGGKEENNNKKLDASVVPSTKYPSYFDLTVWVESTNSTQLESGKFVAFFIHDTFGLMNNVIYAEIGEGGKAQATLVAYEAFTVGALCYDNTTLELDLNKRAGFPSEFYYKD